jgi:16S rRNA (cytosine1402-N4)-methyltransferase
VSKHLKKRAEAEKAPGAPAHYHRAVLLTEVLEALQPCSGKTYFDGTIGGGSHAEAILEASSPTGFLYGCDRDPEAMRAAGERLARFAGRCELRQGNFADAAWLPAGECAGVILDLGVSSRQLDAAERGFSFMQDGPLDMRMNPEQGMTAADIVNERDEEELARLFWELGDERASRRIARRIVEERKVRSITTTGQLAAIVERVNPRRGQASHPATRVFQALRIEVNDEIGSLRRGLDRAWSLLATGGRLAVISFHSLEDRVVKDFMRVQARDYDVSGPVDDPHLRVPRSPRAIAITRKAILPSEAEIESNPRARSAQLRVIESI